MDDAQPDAYDASTYGESFADVYDDWYSDISDVASAVERLAAFAGAGRALELGIGSGRIALPLAERGVDVWGVDASTAMVDRLRTKPGGESIPVAIGDMAALDLSALDGGTDARFDVVFAVYNTFFNLTSEAAQLQCLERVAAVLAPDGRLVIEAFVPNPDAPASSVEARSVGLDHVVLTVSREQQFGQVVDGQHIEITERGVRLRPWRIRYLHPEQLDDLARRAGMHLVDRWSTWSGESLRPGDPVHISVFGGG